MDSSRNDGADNRGYRVGRFPRVSHFRADLHRETRHYWLFPLWVEVDMTRVASLRREWQTTRGIRITYTGLVAKAIADAVAELRDANPELNAAVIGFPWKRMVYFDDVDVAVACEKQYRGAEYFHVGLIRNADGRSPGEIAADLADLAQATEGGEFGETIGLVARPHWIRRFMLWLSRNVPSLVKKHRGTVFLSGVGKYGVNGFAMTNHNLSFSFGPVEERPVAAKGSVTSRLMMTLTMVIDHRTINGGPAARLLGRIRERLEGGEFESPAGEEGGP